MYVSLEQPNGLYWGGATIGWSHLRVNHAATLSGYNSSTGQYTWTKVNDWPTPGQLPNGVYTLRTMARSSSLGNTTGPGLCNTINFTIATADTTSPNPAVLTSPSQSPVADITTLTSLSGTASDNFGGSGVASVRVSLTFNGVSGGVQYWDWVNQNWTSTSGGSNLRKLATLSGGTNWTINSNLPPASKQYGGNYTVQMFTTDVAGNPESTGTGSVKIFQDLAIVTTPAQNSSITSLSVISGTADPGTLNLGLVLSRKNNTSTFQQSWNWTTQTWVAVSSTPDVYTYIFPSNGTWSLTTNLPSGVNLQDDTYNIATFTNNRSGVQGVRDSGFTKGIFSPSSVESSPSKPSSPSAGTS